MRLPHTHLNELLPCGVWFGLATGFGEALGVLTLFRFGWLDWATWTAPVLPIIWIAPVFNLVLFCTFSVVLVAANRLFPTGMSLRRCILVFTFLMFFDWTGLYFRIDVSRHLENASEVTVFLPMVAAALLSAGLAKVMIGLLVPTRLIFFRRSARSLIGIALLVIVGLEGSLSWSERRADNEFALDSEIPNVLVIVLDTVRADHVSTSNYSRNTTPNLNRLAREGVVFENAFAASSWSLPSHASLLTGQYPHQHGAEMKRLDPRAPTIAQILRRYGYRTAAFSANRQFFSRRVGMGVGFNHFEDYFASLSDAAAHTFYGSPLTYILQLTRVEALNRDKRASDITSSTLRWIDGGEPGRSFFAFLNYFDAHYPYFSPLPHRRIFSRGQFDGTIAPVPRPEELQEQIDRYDGAIHYVDHEIGELVVELEKRNLLSNTVIVITSDHGELFGEHHLFGHQNALYEPVVKVPMIWHGPQIPKGVRVSTPVTNVAIPGTLLEVLKLGPAESFKVSSLAPLWDAKTHHVDWPMPLIELARAPLASNDIPAHYGWMKALVGRDWFYVFHETFGAQLFDRRNDANSMQPVTGHQEVLAEFSAHMHELTGRSDNAQP